MCVCHTLLIVTYLLLKLLWAEYYLEAPTAGRRWFNFPTLKDVSSGEITRTPVVAWKIDWSHWLFSFRAADNDPFLWLKGNVDANQAEVNESLPIPGEDEAH